MTTPQSTDAKNWVAKAIPKLPHERDESPEADPENRPEIQRAFEATVDKEQDTTKARETDKTYNDNVVDSDDRQSGTATGRTKPDPAARG